MKGSTAPRARQVMRTPRESTLGIQSLELTGRDFALHVCDLDLPTTGCTAIVGPNGAGKSSLLESLMGVRRARVSGSVYGLSWQDFRSLAARREAGIQLQNFRYPGALQVEDLMRLHRLLYGSADAGVAAQLGMPALSGKYYSQLSRGEKQRVDLYMALAHHPKLVLLDEPGTGLDPHFMTQFCALIRERTDGCTIMVCHSADELALARNLVWVKAGKVERTGQPDALRRELTGDWVLEVTFSSLQARDQAIASIQGLADTRVVKSAGVAPLLTAYGGDALASFGATLVRHPQVVSCRIAATTLADLLRHCAEGGIRD